MLHRMFLFQLLLYLSIIIIIIYCVTKHKVEMYDGRISGITKELCGKICTETFGCIGFAYDGTNSKCYISKRPILYQPGNSLYSDEYNYGHYRCNKIDPLRDDIDNIDTITQDRLRRNMIYSCANEERDMFEIYKIVNNKIEKIPKTNISQDTRPNSFLTVEYEKYPLNEIIWPTQRKDLQPQDLVSKDEEKIKNYILFEKDDKEYLGQYLYPHRCVENVSEEECLETCRKNIDCVGTEFNPVYIKNEKGSNVIYKNVCCPKRKIRDVITRRKEFENGHFYLKKEPVELDKRNVYTKIINYPLN